MASRLFTVRDWLLHLVEIKQISHHLLKAQTNFSDSHQLTDASMA